MARKAKSPSELSVLLPLLRDYAKAARQIGSAGYLHTLEESLAMTLRNVRKLPGADRLTIPEPAKDALVDHLKEWLRVYEHRYDSLSEPLPVETGYLRCDALLVVFEAVLRADALCHIENHAVLLLQNRYSDLSSSALHIYETPGSMLPRDSVAALLGLSDAVRKRNDAPVIRVLRQEIEELI